MNGGKNRLNLNHNLSKQLPMQQSPSLSHSSSITSPVMSSSAASSTNLPASVAAPSLPLHQNNTSNSNSILSPRHLPFPYNINNFHGGGY